jgi:hypothetical protein
MAGLRFWGTNLTVPLAERIWTKARVSGFLMEIGVSHSKRFADSGGWGYGVFE